MGPLNIVHVFRAPVGGLFRHVRDLARGQTERGHRVGLIADSTTGGERAEELLKELAPHLALGVARFPMPRTPGPGYRKPLMQVRARVAELNADIVHGHGAKGGLYARLSSGVALKVYTPHGGSLWFGSSTLKGKIYFIAERFLMRRTDLFLFESAFAEQAFRAKIGEPSATVRVVHNGVTRAEFEPIPLKSDATDVVFMGELRPEKGIDVLIDAVARLHAAGKPVSATLIGDGADGAALRAQIVQHNLARAVRILPAMPGRLAMAHGHMMVMPSRAESLPYVVLEAAAAGKPLISTRVGGIPEIYGPLADHLVPADDAGALAHAIAHALMDRAGSEALAKQLQARVAASFSVEKMVDGVLAAYAAAAENRAKTGSPLTAFRRS